MPEELDPADQRAGRRRRAVEAITRPRFPEYPPELPITGRRTDIMAALRDHQVVIVAGETGSGKSTQLPKICLEMGRGIDGLIGHTQPRRIAARAVAERVAAELGTQIGGVVGYAVRFTDRVGDGTAIKVMTDGVLLNEIHRDRDLRRYDTIILDEVHERSLNIDFLLGYLTRLLPKRPELRLVLTSATLDTERLSAHFGGAPVIEVAGRSYPVEVRYRPILDDADQTDRDEVQAICEAIDELAGEGPGDILVFLSGEREIRDLADALGRGGGRGSRRGSGPDLDILPLYARLSLAEQHRVFQPHAGRRVVLATNVAESSLTVPGIRYVVDLGTARVSRYSARTKVQRLPIEPVSQASASQRAGRCGRIAPGICIRLYAEEDFAGRPAFTDPEILRTSLASVILQMAALDLGEVGAFPFVDPPDARAVRDGILLLQELGAFEPEEPAGPGGSPAGSRRARRRPGPALTKLGRQLARLPVDPRYGRMLLEAGRLGCAREVGVIAAALSIQDPRERPADKAAAADESHARFADERSDFLAFVRLWEYLQDQQERLSSNQFRRLCRSEYLNYLRVREWQDVVAQLARVAAQLGIRPNAEPAEPVQIHRALLSGLLSHIGMWDPARREYQGARNSRFALNPGSVLYRKAPKWVMAAELVETTRLWARVAAPIQPEWAEPLAPGLLRSTYSEPQWDRRRGAAVALARITLYGLPIVTGRRVDYAAIDRPAARELFLWHALVEGDWPGRHRFVEHNRALREDGHRLEERARRADLVIDDDELYAFYDERIPADVATTRQFDAWWKGERTNRPRLLELSRQDVIRPDAAGVRWEDYPGEWPAEPAGDHALAVSYRFAPGEPDDGVTVHVPLTLLNRVEPAGFDWQVPGYREALVVALIRALPKPVRRHFVPAAEYAGRFLATSGPQDGPLLDALQRRLPPMTGDPIPPGSWHLDQVPDYLRITFSVEDGEGHPVAAGKDLAGLRVALRHLLREAIAGALPGLQRSGALSWEFGRVPKVVEEGTARGFPGLEDEGDSVGVRVWASPAEQRGGMWAGTRRLLRLTAGLEQRDLERRLTKATKLALARDPGRPAAAVLENCITAALDQLLAEAGGPVWDGEAFEALRSLVVAGLPDRALGIVNEVAAVLEVAARLESTVARLGSPLLKPAVADVEDQLERLLPANFPISPGAVRLADVRRYLLAAERRLEKLPENPGRDRARMAAVHALEQEYEQVAARLPTVEQRAEARRLRWMLEELRVSLFAQTVGSRYPVSEKRVRQALAELAG